MKTTTKLIRVMSKPDIIDRLKRINETEKQIAHSRSVRLTQTKVQEIEKLSEEIKTLIMRYTKLR